MPTGPLAWFGGAAPPPGDWRPAGYARWRRLTLLRSEIPDGAAHMAVSFSGSRPLYRSTANGGLLRADAFDLVYHLDGSATRLPHKRVSWNATTGARHVKLILPVGDDPDADVAFFEFVGNPDQAAETAQASVVDAATVQGSIAATAEFPLRLSFAHLASEAVTLDAPHRLARVARSGTVSIPVADLAAGESVSAAGTPPSGTVVASGGGLDYAAPAADGTHEWEYTLKRGADTEPGWVRVVVSGDGEPPGEVETDLPTAPAVAAHWRVMRLSTSSAVAVQGTDHVELRGSTGSGETQGVGICTLAQFGPRKSVEWYYMPLESLVAAGGVFSQAWLVAGLSPANVAQFAADFVPGDTGFSTSAVGGRISYDTKNADLSIADKVRLRLLDGTAILPAVDPDAARDFAFPRNAWSRCRATVEGDTFTFEAWPGDAAAAPVVQVHQDPLIATWLGRATNLVLTVSKLRRAAFRDVSATVRTGGGGGGGGGGGPAEEPLTAPLRIVQAANRAALDAALADARAGDHVVLTGSSYGGSITFSSTVGTATAKLVVRSGTVSGLTITDDILGASFDGVVTFSGDHTVVRGCVAEKVDFVGTASSTNRFNRGRIRSTRDYLVLFDAGADHLVDFCEVGPFGQAGVAAHAVKFGGGTRRCKLHASWVHDQAEVSGLESMTFFGEGNNTSAEYIAGTVDWCRYSGPATRNSFEIKSSGNTLSNTTFVGDGGNDLYIRHGMDNTFIGVWVKDARLRVCDERATVVRCKAVGSGLIGVLTGTGTGDQIRNKQPGQAAPYAYAEDARVVGCEGRVVVGDTQGYASRDRPPLRTKVERRDLMTSAPERGLSGTAWTESDSTSWAGALPDPAEIPEPAVAAGQGDVIGPFAGL